MMSAKSQYFRAHSSPSRLSDASLENKASVAIWLIDEIVRASASFQTSTQQFTFVFSMRKFFPYVSKPAKFVQQIDG